MNLSLKIAILASGKRQQRVADLAHMDRTKLSHVVADRRAPSQKEIEALCRVLGESARVLFPDTINKGSIRKETNDDEEGRTL